MPENSKYTPTDDDMREAWRAFTGANRSLGSFDRWLAAHDAQVARNTLNGYAVHLWSGGSEDATGAKRVMDYTRTHFPEEPTDA